MYPLPFWLKPDAGEGQIGIKMVLRDTNCYSEIYPLPFWLKPNAGEGQMGIKMVLRDTNCYSEIPDSI